MKIQIIGIYPVDRAEEPCHLIEMKIVRSGEELDIAAFTQEMADQPRSNWQVPYDEHYLNSEGIIVLNPDNPNQIPVGDNLRIVFFFHYLDFDKPLETPVGDIKLPQSTAMPSRLSFLKYESPG